MAYPNRTYANVTLPGAASATKVLKNPVDIDVDGEDYLEGFIATEETGVGRVETTS